MPSFSSFFITFLLDLVSPASLSSHSDPSNDATHYNERSNGSTDPGALKSPHCSRWNEMQALGDASTVGADYWPHGVKRVPRGVKDASIAR
jgi:hypothetical protein